MNVFYGQPIKVVLNVEDYFHVQARVATYFGVSSLSGNALGPCYDCREYILTIRMHIRDIALKILSPSPCFA